MLVPPPGAQVKAWPQFSRCWRLSTQDQNLDMQIEALTKAGCKELFDDKISGSRAERPGLIKTLEMLREGDWHAIGPFLLSCHGQLG